MHRHRLQGATRGSLSAVAAALLSACASGPDYQAPKASTPERFLNGPAATSVALVASGTATANIADIADIADIAEFWRGFADPVLDSLVQQALQANTDVRIAQARLTEARASLQGTEADALPSFGLQADINRSVTPKYQLPGASRSQRTATVYAPGALMNWELDLFGRNRRATESAAAQVQVQELGIAAAQVAVTAGVATSYLNLRGLQGRMDVARTALANQREALRLTDVRLAAGRGTAFDLERIRAQVASTAATLPALQALADQAVQRIATLTGTASATVAATLAPPAPLPGMAVTDLAALPLGTPEALLRRRPDIQAAERQMAAASADIGVAQADRFPRLSLNGLLGLNSNSASGLSGGGAGVFSLGAALSWTAWDFGRTGARVAAAEARSERSRVVYEQTVLGALEETESALSGFSRSAEQAREFGNAARSAEAAAAIARARLAAGNVDLLIVLDAERTALSARDQLAQVEAGTATALVAVYRALGGGWPNR